MSTCSSSRLAGVAADLEVPSAPCGRNLPRLLPGLLDGDLGAALAGFGKVLDAAVDGRTNPLQELDPGIGEVFPHLGRHTEGFPKLVHNFAAQAALLKRRGRLLFGCFFFAYFGSFPSSLRICFFGRAPAAASAATDRADAS